VSGGLRAAGRRGRVLGLTGSCSVSGRFAIDCVGDWLGFFAGLDSGGLPGFLQVGYLGELAGSGLTGLVGRIGCGGLTGVLFILDGMQRSRARVCQDPGR
jgi:hypothetical protein